MGIKNHHGVVLVKGIQHSESQRLEIEYFNKLKLDYEQTVLIFNSLAEIRFKLLAMVPTFTVVAIGVIDKLVSNPSTMLAIGALGFLATLGIAFYDQRNTQLYNSAQLRAKSLEALMNFEKLKKFENIRSWHPV